MFCKQFVRVHTGCGHAQIHNQHTSGRLDQPCLCIQGGPIDRTTSILNGICERCEQDEPDGMNEEAMELEERAQAIAAVEAYESRRRLLRGPSRIRGARNFEPDEYLRGSRQRDAALAAFREPEIRRNPFRGHTNEVLDPDNDSAREVIDISLREAAIAGDDGFEVRMSPVRRPADDNFEEEDESREMRDRDAALAAVEDFVRRYPSRRSARQDPERQDRSRERNQRGRAASQRREQARLDYTSRPGTRGREVRQERGPQSWSRPAVSLAEQEFTLDPNSESSLLLERVEGDSEVCVICLEVMQAQEDIRRLPCRHRFHRTCIVNWFQEGNGNNTCPMCREPFNIVSPDNPFQSRVSRSRPSWRPRQQSPSQWPRNGRSRSPNNTSTERRQQHSRNRHHYRSHSPSNLSSRSRQQLPGSAFVVPGSVPDFRLPQFDPNFVNYGDLVNHEQHYEEHFRPFETQFRDYDNNVARFESDTLDPATFYDWSLSPQVFSPELRREDGRRRRISDFGSEELQFRREELNAGRFGL